MGAKCIVAQNVSLISPKTFDISDEPITEGINFEIAAESENADKQKLQELIKMAEERSPAMYSMTHEIKVNVQIK